MLYENLPAIFATGTVTYQTAPPEFSTHAAPQGFGWQISGEGIFMVVLMIVNFLLAISTWRNRASRRIALLQASASDIPDRNFQTFNTVLNYRYRSPHQKRTRLF